MIASDHSPLSLWTSQLQGHQDWGAKRLMGQRRKTCDPLGAPLLRSAATLLPPRRRCEAAASLLCLPWVCDLESVCDIYQVINKCLFNK